MVEKLKIKLIYEDFVSKVSLTDEQMRILKMLINRDTTIKISMAIGVSQRTLGTEIRKLKNLYKDYLALEKTKLEVLLKE